MLKISGQKVCTIDRSSALYKKISAVNPRLAAKESSIWGVAAEAEARVRLNWIDAPESSRELLPQLDAVSAKFRNHSRVVLCGMGGSSLAPEVIAVAVPVEPDPVPIVIEAPPPPPIKGNWNFQTQATTSNYKLYEGLVSVYRIDLYYIGPPQVEGNGELWSEAKPGVVGREAEVVGKNHAPIAIRGSVEGNSLHLSFEVKATSRTFTGSADFTWDDATTSWIGKYYSGAGASSGTASLTQR